MRVHIIIVAPESNISPGVHCSAVGNISFATETSDDPQTRGQEPNDGILVGEVWGYVPLAAEKRGAIVDMHAGAFFSGIELPRSSNDGMQYFQGYDGAGYGV